ncbi:P-loop NTPase fold protein [Rhizobium leguminosarum]|uniref:P-loop NTPase fold protein n=1 Tax=Rhizobium leguminosarum TaxID=384 RepID=UPI003F9D237B
MSLKLIEEEIQRFLGSPDPEVLCITGKWGVGKTYTWDRLLAQAHARPEGLAIQKYSYVTLFGLNSLEDLRFSIFENTVSGANLSKDASLKSFVELIAVGGDVARKGRHVLELVSAFFNRKAIADVVLKAGFLNVRTQLVCIDDLERAGKGLEVRDVLGLISFLKTKRDCKVVLLLNEEQFDSGNKLEFRTQLEKVADKILVFDLLPNEAIEIAFTGPESAVQTIIKPLIGILRITNIRIIKKIEKAADRLAEILKDHEKPIVNDAITALVLGMWAHLEPNTPPISFIRNYNGFFDSIPSKNGQDVDELSYAKMLEPYPYSSTDELDNVVLDGAEAGYFNSTRLLEVADLVASRNRKAEGGGTFSRVWAEMYHRSLAVDDAMFLDALFESGVHEAALITPLNMNSAIKMLRENGRSEQADELVQKYVAARTDEALEFFDINNHHFTVQDGVDPRFRAAFEEKFASFVDDRDPFDVLKKVGSQGNWSAADAAMLSKLSAEDFERMFEKLDGDLLRSTIEAVLHLGNSSTPDAGAIRHAAKEGLRRIGRKSPLRAQKVARYGVIIEEPEGSAETQPHAV